MKDNKIFYITYFDNLDSENIRNVPLAAVSKSTYISKKLSSLGYNVQIISPALPNCKGKFKASNKYVYENVRLKLFGSFYASSKLSRLLRKIIHAFKLCTYLLFKIPRNSKVIVYHSLSLMKIIKLFKILKKPYLILEFNEVYGDVIGDRKISRNELMFSSIADAYIFPSEILSEKINLERKPIAINHGTYEVTEFTKSNFSDNLVHCVYAGTFSKGKGVENAIKCAEYLGENYHLHILGFGTHSEISDVKNLIIETQKKSKSKITYHGTLIGNEFQSFIRKCDIGLCTQTSKNTFNETSFPSKVLMYMSNGLKVVSVKIDVLFMSSLKECIIFYESNSPEYISDAIKYASTLELNHFPQDIVRSLDEKFTHSLKKILG